MDYMCELPNDAARRTALDSLPPDLNATYERILSRVNQSNVETQKLVRRALRWIANDGKFDLTAEAVCEAVSIDFGTTKRNAQAIPEEFEILHWCSSLVRKSEDNETLEFAHFTVKEFLQQIGSEQGLPISAYRIDRARDELILAKVCLTYLNLQDFDQGGPINRDAVERRLDVYPFRRLAVEHWVDLARDHLRDSHLLSLVQKLLNPSKPNTLISWVHDYFDYTLKEDDYRTVNSGVAEATALHYAAMLGLTEVCSWLIKSGCDVNRNSTTFGTPLQCALFNHNPIAWSLRHDSRFDSDDFYGHYIPVETVDLLLEAGADPSWDADTKMVSPLLPALVNKPELALRLLDRGAIMDSDCLKFLENKCDDRFEVMEEIVDHCTNHNLRQENYSRFLQLALRAKTSNATHLTHNDTGLPFPTPHYEQALRTAAEYGQVEMVIRLLEDQKLHVDAADESTGSTALHYAASNHQVEVAQILIDHGASLSRSDNLGRTALHRSVEGSDCRCLEFFLERNADTSLPDLDGMTVWHLVAQKGSVQALSILLNEPVDASSRMGLQTADGRTPILCASEHGSKEAMRLLLNAGSSLTETDSDGSSLFHYAVKSGNLECMQFLIEQAIDPCTVAHDGSTAIHYALSRKSEIPGEKLVKIVQYLLDNGVDPSKTRNDGCTPLHDLVEIIKHAYKWIHTDLDHLFATGRTLLKNLLKNARPASGLRLGSELIYLACLHSLPSSHEIVSALLELGLDSNVRSADGRTALIAAAESGNGAIFSTLLLHGADPCIDDSGLDALHCACFKDHENILVLLRGTSIDWNSQSATTEWGSRRRENVTALHIAARIKNSNVLKFLLNQDLMSNIDALTSVGETPLLLALRNRADKNMSLLLSNGADSTIDAYDGQSVAHWAAEWGDMEAISEFIRHGSDLGLPNNRGLTPELVARKYGHEALAKIIMDYVNEASGFRKSAPMKLCGLSNPLLLQRKNRMDPHIVQDQEPNTEIWKQSR